MKKYGLFGGKRYYAAGGMNDFIGYCDTVLEAVNKGTLALENDYSMGWYHVYDMETLKRVAQSECVPYRDED